MLGWGRLNEERLPILKTKLSCRFDLRASRLLLMTALLFGATEARADVLRDVKMDGAPEHKLELAFTLSGWIPSSDVDALARCLPKKERRLGSKGDAARYFRGIRWETKRLKELDECNVKHCVFNIPKWARRKVMAAKDNAERVRTYYDVVRDLTWKIDKKKKTARIKAYRLANEPCGKHDLLHWLLDGPLKPWDRIIWRKHFAKKMRPTLMTLQMSSWRAGDYRCIGTSVLFGDHYYYDGIDLLQLKQVESGKVAFRLHVRERYDVMKEWWARTFRSRFRNDVKRRKLALLRNRIARCLK